MAAAADGISGDYGPLLELVQQLACSCVPIMLENELEDFGGADNQPLPPTLTDPKLSMNEVDNEMLLCETFLFHLCGQCHTFSNVRLARTIIHHLCYCNNQASATLIAQIVAGVEKLDGDLLKPYFVALGIIFDIEDKEDLSRLRLDYALKKVFSVMRDMQNYADATYVSIGCIVKLAATRPRILAWMLDEQNQTAWIWTEQWLRAKVAKATAYTSAYSYAATAPSANVKRAKTLLAHVTDLLDRCPPRMCLYDESDDPQGLINRSVCLSVDGGSLAACVVSYDARTGFHTLESDDGQQRDCNMLSHYFLFAEQVQAGASDSDADSDSDDPIGDGRQAA